MSETPFIRPYCYVCKDAAAEVPRAEVEALRRHLGTLTRLAMEAVSEDPERVRFGSPLDKLNRFLMGLREEDKP
jgi:hypothetical protein